MKSTPQYSFLCQLLCVCFACLFLLKLTAGMPSKGSSYTLNCSVPGRGISGLLRGWLFPFSISCFIGAFFVVLFVLGAPVQETLLWFSLGRRLLKFCSVVQLERGKPRVAGLTPRPTWFPRELLMPLLKMLFSEIPVALSLGNWVGTSLTGSSFCQNTQRQMRFYPTSSAGSTFLIFSSPSKATSRGNFIILLLPQRRFFLIANRVLISRNLLVSLSLTELKTAHSWCGEKLALFSHPIWFCPLRWSPLSLECATMRVFWTYGLKILRFRWITFLAYLAVFKSHFQTTFDD